MPPANPPFISAIVKLDVRKSRFTLSSEVVRSAGWQDLSDGEVLSAEFVTVGHYRLHRKAEFKHQITAFEKRAVYGLPSGEKSRALQLAADRIRDVVFNMSDNHRVWVGVEIVFGLVGPPPYELPVYLYLQAGDKCVDVMTNECRIRRLTASSEDDPIFTSES